MNVNESPDFERQYDALRHGKTVIELGGWSSISIRGKDRQPFLHNFCTNDVKRLTVGASCEAFITDVKGKTLGHGVICCKADELEFVGAPGQAAAVIAHLDRYIIREDVQLLDTTEVRRQLLLAGCELQQRDAFTWNILGTPTTQILEVAVEDFSSTLASLLEAGLVAVEEPTFEAARIEAGLPLFGIDFTADNLPQEIGRDRKAISFTKGCYLGQETVARIDALGHVNQSIACVRFASEHIPAIGSDLKKAGAASGRITSAAYSPTLKSPIALAIIRRSANSLGTQLESDVGECEVIEFPVRKLA